MNGYQIIRNFNISILTDSEMDENCLNIYNYLENLFSDLNIYTCDENFYKDKKYFGKDIDDLIIGFDLIESEGWIYKKIWKNMHHLYNLSQESTVMIIKWYLIYRFNLTIEICEVDNITSGNFSPALTPDFYIIGNTNNTSLDIK